MGKACLVCGDAKTVKSHLLPKAMMHDQRQGWSSLLAMKSGDDRIAGLQSGHWAHILCGAHEAALGEPDRKAVQFVRDFYTLAKREGAGLAWRVDQFDFDSLRLFAYACIWRTVAGGATSKGLGAYDAILRSILFEGAMDRPGLVLERRNNFDNQNRESHITILPHPARIGGVRMWSFTVAGLRWWVKLDGRPLDPDLRPVETKGVPFYVINREPRHLGRDSDLKPFTPTGRRWVSKLF